MTVPKKIYLTTDGDNSFVFTQKRSDNKGIEYVRKDAFIEKACEWLKKNRKNYSSNALGEEYLIDDFKKTMKGE